MPFSLDLLAGSAALIDAPQVMYWRTASGREVGFVARYPWPPTGWQGTDSVAGASGAS